MKKYLLASIMLLVLGSAFAQTKPKQKEKPPTQKEMDNMMKELQKGQDEMSPEDKKIITDVGVVAGVAANAGGVNIAGADVKITVNGGVSRSGSTILQGIK